MWFLCRVFSNARDLIGLRDVGASSHELVVLLPQDVGVV